MREVPDETASRMRSAIGRLARGLRQTRAGTDLTPSQYEVFARITWAGRMPLSELATVESLNPTLISRVVGKLEEAGLVAREQDPDDRRVAHAVSTAKGRELYEQIRHERTDVLTVALEGLSKDELRRLTAALPVLESLAAKLKDRRP
jgi:DNA-binding MarR family transcriptional regulator